MNLGGVLLFLHVASGSVALLTAGLAFLSEKGPTFHAKVGRIYAMSMVSVGLTAVGLWLLGSADFLLFIAFFSSYLVLVGWRLGQNRRGQVTRVDRTLMGMGLVGTVGLLIIAVDITVLGAGPWDQSSSFAVVPLVFSIICGVLTRFQFISMKNGVGPKGKERIRQHGIYMGAGTISTVTAFLLTAVGGGVVMWLLPTVVGTALILWNLGGLRTGRVLAPEPV